MMMMVVVKMLVLMMMMVLVVMLVLVLVLMVLVLVLLLARARWYALQSWWDDVDRRLLVELQPLLLPPIGDTGTTRRGIHRSAACRAFSLLVSKQPSCWPQRLPSGYELRSCRMVLMLSPFHVALASLPKDFSFSSVFPPYFSLCVSLLILSLSGKARNE